MARLLRLATVMGVLTACILPMFLLVALPAELGAVLSRSGLGLAVGAFWASSGVFSVPAGRLVSVRGPRWGMAVAAAGGTVVPVLLCGVGASVLTFVLAMVGSGILYSLATCAANSALTQGGSSSRRGLIFSVKQSTVPLAGALAGAVAVTCARSGWQTCFAVAAGLSGLAAVASLSLTRSSAGPRRVRVPLRLRDTGPLAVVSLGACLGTAAANAFGAFLVASLVAGGWSEHAGAVVLACGNAVGIAGRVLAGVLVDRMSAGHFVLTTAMLGVGALGLTLLAAGSETALVVGIALMYLAGWSWPGILQHSVIRAAALDAAQVTGVIQVGPFVGGALGPVLFAQLLGHAGYSEAWVAAAVSAAVGGLVVLVGSARLSGAGPGLGAA